MINSVHPNITIPNFITLMSAVSGLIGIYYISQTNIPLAIFYLVLCDIFDTLDGYVARKFHMISPIGMDLDSLVDAIVFLIPQFLIFLSYKSLTLTISSILVVLAGVYRLARYNVEPSVKGKVKGLIASQPAHYIYLSLLLGLNTNFLIVLCITSSILMILPFYTNEKITNTASKLFIVLNLIFSLIQVIKL